MRLQKFLAHAGVASRRAAEKIITGGRVCLNGETVTHPGTPVVPEQDTVTLDGQPIVPEQKSLTLLLYKPRGYISSTSSVQGKSVLELLPEGMPRLYPVGRLDKNSEGLLLLTNDGNLANRLTHPRYEHRKIYEVTVSGHLSDAVIRKLNRPMVIDGYRIRPAKVKLLRALDNGRTVLGFELREGRNRQIRKMCEALNLRVNRLIRTKIGNLKVGNLRPGEWRELSHAELTQLVDEK